MRAFFTVSALVLGFFFSLVSAQAQFYSGVNPVTLSSENKGQSMQLVSNQLVTDFDATNRVLKMRMKTQGLWFTSNAEQQEVLSKVFEVEAFPLWAMSIDLSSFKTIPEKEVLLVPVTVEYHGHQVTVPQALLKLREQATETNYDLTFAFTLSELGMLADLAPFSTISSQWILTVKDARLTRR
jgi:hypothetical protein